MVKSTFELLEILFTKLRQGSAGVQLSSSPIKMWIGESVNSVFSGSKKQGG